VPKLQDVKKSNGVIALNFKCKILFLSLLFMYLGKLSSNKQIRPMRFKI